MLNIVHWNVEEMFCGFQYVGVVNYNIFDLIYFGLTCVYEFIC